MEKTPRYGYLPINLSNKIVTEENNEIAVFEG